MSRFWEGLVAGVFAVVAFLLGRACAPQAPTQGPVVIRDTVYIRVHDTIQTLITREVKPIYIVQSPETLRRVDTIWGWVSPGETPPLAYGVWTQGGEVVIGALSLQLDSTGGALYHPSEWHFSRPQGEGWDWWAVSRGDTPGWALYRRHRLSMRPHLGGEVNLSPRGLSIYPLVGLSASWGNLEGRAEAYWPGVRTSLTWRF